MAASQEDAEVASSARSIAVLSVGALVCKKGWWLQVRQGLDGRLNVRKDGCRWSQGRAQVAHGAHREQHAWGQAQMHTDCMGMGGGEWLTA